jgi:hypothetical protein
MDVVAGGWSQQSIRSRLLPSVSDPLFLDGQLPRDQPELAPPDSSKSAITSSSCCTAISSIPAETMFVERSAIETLPRRSRLDL